MFDSESILQNLVHEKPEVILSGIPEINPQYCPDTPTIISLGREIPLSSGPIDNLYIDTNAIITFVECKRYSDSRIRREVYSQAINYASDLQNMLSHYSGNQFCDEFFNIINKGQDSQFMGYQEIIDVLSEDPLLNGKHIDDWQDQFIQRLEYNIKAGVFRIVIACGPSPDNIFSYSTIRNLIQLMSFSEANNNKYDLLLLDIREEDGKYNSKIIWRRYAYLPQIPLIAQATRDTSSGIEAMNNRYSALPGSERRLLDELKLALNHYDYYLLENTQGYAVYSEKTNQSMYVLIRIDSEDWKVVRHQITEPEKLFYLVEDHQIDELVCEFDYQVRNKLTSKKEPMHEIIITPTKETQVE